MVAILVAGAAAETPSYTVIVPPAPATELITIVPRTPGPVLSTVVVFVVMFAYALALYCPKRPRIILLLLRECEGECFARLWCLTCMTKLAKDVLHVEWVVLRAVPYVLGRRGTSRPHMRDVCEGVNDVIMHAERELQELVDECTLSLAYPHLSLGKEGLKRGTYTHFL